MRTKTQDSIVVFLICVLLAMTAGCSPKSSGATAPQPFEVQIAEVQQKDVPLYGEWIGTLDGVVNADIKAQVSAYLVEQAYTEGTFVTKGQLLFQIDPRPFQAALDQIEGQQAQSQGQLEQARAQLGQAEAQVAVAEANHRRTQLDVDVAGSATRRHRPLGHSPACCRRRQQYGENPACEGW